MSSIILAGGRSTRLGKEKPSLVINGKSLLQSTIDHLNELDDEVILVLAQTQTASSLNSSQRVKITADLYDAKGPLVGIYSGLKVSASQHNLAVACDMPFLNSDLLRYMLTLAPGFDIVIPMIDDFLEPLHAVYSRDCLENIENMLKRGELSVIRLVEQVNVRYVGKSEVDEFDPEHLSFFNINTPADLQKAEEIITRGGAYSDSSWRGSGSKLK